MNIEQTLCIIKPNRIPKSPEERADQINKIFEMIGAAGLWVVAAKVVILTRQQAQIHYAEHKEKRFFGELCDDITSAPVVLAVLEGSNAIQNYRTLAGPTDPAEAREKAPKSIRALFGEDKGANSVHSSDGPKSASREIGHFFTPKELKTKSVPMPAYLVPPAP